MEKEGGGGGRGVTDLDVFLGLLLSVIPEAVV